jgi:hypothetical protein
MSALWLTVEASPGSDIYTACEEAVALADKLALSVWFDFNGVKVLACRGDDPKRIARSWSESLESKRRYKIASDRGAPQGDQQ